MGSMGSAANRVTKRGVIALALLITATMLVAGARLLPAHADQVTVAGEGYWMVASDGGIFSLGDARFYGSRGGQPLNQPIVGMAATPTGKGYWFVASDGGIFSYGDAEFFGSTGGQPLNKPIVGMAATPTGKGYWLVASDGGIFTFGDADFFGSRGGQPLNQPIVGMAPTPSGRGYWFVASDGGIFSYGDADFFGSMGGQPLNRPIVGMAPHWDGEGYWFVASDGGIFSFGTAPFYGSTGGQPISAPIVSMAADPAGFGYWLVGSDGEVYPFGDAPDYGSLGGQALNKPIVGMAPTTFVDNVPVARDDAYVTGKNQKLTVAAPGVLANDSDADGDVLGAVMWDGPSHGTATMNDNGSFEYTPAADYTGSDSFTYLGHDYIVGDLATVTITVNNPPALEVTGGPASGASSNDPTPTYSGTTADLDGTVSSVQASVNSGPWTPFCTSSCATWTYNHGTALAPGLHSFRFRALDNRGTASTIATRTVRIDTTAPTATINQKSGQADPTNASPVEFTVVFSEAVTGFAADDLGFTAGATNTATRGLPVVTGNGTTYNVAIPLTADGTVTPTIDAAKASDAAGNGNVAATSTDNSVAYDATKPTFDAVVATAESTAVVASFSEPLLCSTVAAGDFLATVDGSPVAVTGATCTPSSDSTIELTLESAPTTDQSVEITVGAVTDPAGNALAAPFSRQDETNATPLVAVTGGPADESSGNDNTPTYNGTASDADGGTVNKVEAKVDNGLYSVAGVACTDCGTAAATWTYTPTTSLSDGLHTFTFRAVDDAGVASAAPVVRRLTIDTGAPTVTINEATGQADPTKASPIAFSVRFSEPVFGFDATDLSFTGNATRGTPTVTGSGADYEVSVPVTTEGTVTAAIDAAKAVDAGGNPNAAATSTDATVTYDTTGPTVTIEEADGQADPTNGSSAAFAVTFSDAPEGLTVGDFTLEGAATRGTPTLTGSGTAYTLTVPLSSDGDVVASMLAGKVTDEAGNDNSPSTSDDNQVTRDATAPTVTVAKADGQADPTNLATVQFTVTFNETVTGFGQADDVRITGTATTGTPVITGMGPYTVTVPVTSNGTVVLDVPAGRAQDTATNGNAQSDEATVTRDAAQPQFSSIAATNGSTTVVATFSELLNCSSVSAADFSASFGTTGKAVDSADCTDASDDTIELTLAEAPTAGTVVNVTLVGLVTDTAGNSANPQTRSTTTNALPTLAVSDGPADAGTTNDPTPTYSGTAADTDGTVAAVKAKVNDGELSTNGVTCTACGTAAATWTYTPTTALGAGPQAIGFVAVDDDGEATSPVVTRTVAVDLVGPTATVNQKDGQADPTNGEDVVFTVTFSEPVTGFDAADLTLTGGATRGTPTHTGNAASYEVTVPVTGNGTVTAALDAAKANDLAGNPNVAATTTDDTVTVDNTDPVFESVSAVNGVGAATAGFDEDLLCSSVTAGDFTVTIDLAPTGITGITCDGAAVELALDAAPDAASTVRVTLTGAVTDLAGNEAARPTSVTSVTNRLPSITVTGGPADNTQSSDNTPTYSGTASDADGMVDEVQAKVGAGAFSTDGVTCTGCGTAAATWTYTPATALADGAHTIQFRAVDDDDEATATPPSRSVTIDAGRPNVTVERASADRTNTSPVAFTVTFSENVTGFDATDIDFTGSTATRGVATVTPATGPEDVYTLTVPVTTDGILVASIGENKAADTAGNGNFASTSLDNSVTYDTTAPVFTTLTAEDDNPVVTATFGEALLCSTVQAVDFTATVNGLPADVTAVVCGGTTDATISLTLDDAPAPGEAVIVDLAANAVTDEAGNAAAARQRTSNATTRPVLAVDDAASPADASKSSSSTPTYTGTATDSDGLVTSVEVSVDGGAFTTNGVTCTNCETDSATWSFTPTAALADGLHTFAFRAWDNGNAVSSDAGVSRSLTIDTVRPAVSIADLGSTNDDPLAFTVTFDEPVDGFDARTDVVVSGTAFTVPETANTVATVTFTEVDEQTYTVTVDGTQKDGTVSIAVPDGAATDKAGNSSTASTDPGTAAFETVAPTVTVARAADQPEFTNQPTAVFAIDFSEVVTDFTLADVDIDDGTAPRGTATLAGSGTAYTLTIPTTGDGTVIVSLPADAAHDAAGNGTAAVAPDATTTVTRDTVDPTVVSVAKGSTQATPTNDSPVSFDVTFSESVTDFDDVADVTVGGDATTGTPTFGGSGTVHTVSVPVTEDGDVTLAVVLDAASDAAGNGNTASTASAPVVFDATAPTLDTVDPDAGSTTVTATFSEDLLCSSVAKTDFTATFGTMPAVPVLVDEAACEGDSVALTLATAPAVDTTVTITVIGTVTDLAGNEVDAPESKSGVTNVLPTVTVSSLADNASTNDPTPTYAGTATDTDGTVSAVKVAVGTDTPSTSGVTCTGCGTANATWSWTPATALEPGDYVVHFSAVDDEAGEATAVDRNLTVDTDNPGVTVARADGQSALTNDSGDISFAVTFDEAVVGFAADDLTLAGSAPRGTPTVTAGSNDGEYTVAVPVTGDGTVSLTVGAAKATDAAGNPNDAATTTPSVTVDRTDPTVIVSGAPADNSGPLTFTVVFSEAPTSFDEDDVNVDGDAFTLLSPADVTVTGSGTTYTVDVAAPSAEGDVTVSIDANAVSDAAGNGNDPSNSATTDYDTTQPTVTLAQVGTADPTTASSEQFTITFSEPVQHFALGDVTVAGPAGTPTLTGTGPAYTLTVPLTGDGTVTVSVAGGVATDPAGNANAASTGDGAVTRDTAGPAFQRIAATVGNATAKLTFGESLDCTTVDKADFTASFGGGGIAVNTAACAEGSTTVVDITFASAPTAGQYVIVRVSVANNITDTLGNVAPSTLLGAPAMSITAGQTPVPSTTSGAETTSDPTPKYEGTATAHAGFTPVATVTVKVGNAAASSDGVTCTGCGSRNATWTWEPTTALIPGSYTLTFIVTDEAGSTVETTRTLAVAGVIIPT